MKARKLYAILLAVVMVFTLMPAMAFAETGTDIGSCRMLFNGNGDYDWIVFCPIENKDKKLSLEDLRIKLNDADGKEVTADAYELKFCEETGWNEQENRPILNEIAGPVGLNGEDVESGFSSYYVVAEAKAGKGFTGSLEQEICVADIHSLNWICADISFDSFHKDGWRMSDRFWVWKSRMGEPEVKTSYNMQTLTAGKDYKVEWFKRSGNVDDNNFEKDKWDYLVRSSKTKLDSYPDKTGGYFAVVEGIAPYYGEAVVLVDVAEPMSVKTQTKTVKYSKVRNKAQTVAALTVSNGIGSISYKGSGTDAKSKKALSINSKSGKITVKKGTKKGSYRIKVKITDKGNNWYDGKTVTKTVTVKVK